MSKQSPIFSKTYDLVVWLVSLTIKFPRQQRFVMAATLQGEAMRFQELIIQAVHQPSPMNHLHSADAALDQLRTHLRMCLDLKLITPNQYEHAARMTTEIGRLLGGWKTSLLKGNTAVKEEAAHGQPKKLAAPSL